MNMNTQAEIDALPLLDAIAWGVVADMWEIVYRLSRAQDVRQGHRNASDHKAHAAILAALRRVAK